MNSSALPFGSITLFSPKSPNSPSNQMENGSQTEEVSIYMGAGLGPRQSSQGWTEVMRDLLLRITTPRIRRCGLIGYTDPSVLQEALDWENNRVAQNSRIEVELNKRGRAKARCEWEHHYAQACWIKRGWRVAPGRIAR